MSRYHRNPWHGVDTRKEFLYDVRHPGQFLRGGLDGMMGRNPGVTREMRILGFALVASGLLQVAAGALMLIRAYFL